MSDYNSQAIVLKSQSYREDDKLITAFCSQYGKQTLVLKSGLKIKSKMAGHLDIGSIVDLEWATGNYFNVITGATAINNLKNIRTDLTKIIYLNSVVVSLDKLIIEKEPNQKIYDLTFEFINLLDEVKNNFEIEMIYQSWWWQVLVELGFSPNLKNCCRCGRELNQETEVVFDFEVGSLGHNQCLSAKINCKAYKKEEIKLIKLLLEKEMDFWRSKKIKPELIQKGREVLQNFVAFRDLDFNQKMFAKKINEEF